MFNDFRKDVAAMVGGASGPRTIVRALVFPNVRAVAYYRVGHWLANHGMLPLAYLLRFRALRITGADINPRAVIGEGFNLVHTSGVVIGNDVNTGDNLTVYQGVTLGTGKTPGMPTIGHNVLISAGAKVLGGVVIHDGRKIRANDVVHGDVVVNVMPTPPVPSRYTGLPMAVSVNWEPRTDRLL